jgi:hypothetical protein
VEGKGDERRGKKRGRGLNVYTLVVCLCGGGQNVGVMDGACALDHHHPCLALYVPAKFSSQNVVECMRSLYPLSCTTM